MSDPTRYFGFVTVSLELLMILGCIILKSPDFTEPFSQYGSYCETRWLFGGIFTLASATYYLFSRHLDSYWKYTSKFAIIAGVAFSITGWAPYQRGLDSLVLDIHNIALVIAILCFTTPMLFISFKKTHQHIAFVSRIGFLLIFTGTVLSFLALISGRNVIFGQMLSLLLFHVWLITVNMLLLRHHKITEHSL